MARCLLVWELGANLGHVAPMRMLAQALVARGHTVSFIARDLNSAEELLEPQLGPVLQAPLRISAGRNPVRTQVSYASLLNNSGFDEILGLTARLRAWRQLYSTLKPELIFADHSPTALLAARTLSIPCVNLGTGFTVPPLRTPFPVFQPGTLIAPEILGRNEAAVLSNINRALTHLQLAPLAALQDVLSHAHHWVCSYPELDHYESPRAEPYAGAPDCTRGAVPPWPAGNGPRVLAYLRPFKDLQAVLQALAKLRARVLVRVGDTPAHKLQGLARPGMVITDQPVHMGQAARDCDAYVSYGSHGFVADMLLAGKPGLLLPTVLERSLVTRRVLQLGAAVSPSPQDKSFNVSAALRQILDDPRLRQNAQAFAARYAQQDRSQIMAHIADAALKFP